MRHYENLVIVKPTLTQEEIENTIAAIEDVLTSNGAEITARDKMGIRKLAYPIQKNERGYFHVMYYTAKPSVIGEIERRFRINEAILRFATIKYDSKREIAAWDKLVQKANTINKSTPVQASSAEEVVVEETIVTAPETVVEEVVVQETPIQE